MSYHQIRLEIEKLVVTENLFFQIFNFHFLCELVIYSLISSVSALLLTTPRTNLPKCRKWRTPSISRRRRKEKSSSWKPSWTRTERKRRKKRWRKSSLPWLSGKMSGDCNLKESENDYSVWSAPGIRNASNWRQVCRKYFDFFLFWTALYFPMSSTACKRIIWSWKSWSTCIWWITPSLNRIWP